MEDFPLEILLQIALCGPATWFGLATTLCAELNDERYRQLARRRFFHKEIYVSPKGWQRKTYVSRSGRPTYYPGKYTSVESGMIGISKLPHLPLAIAEEILDDKHYERSDETRAPVFSARTGTGPTSMKQIKRLVRHIKIILEHNIDYLGRQCTGYRRTRYTSQDAKVKSLEICVASDTWGLNIWVARVKVVIIGEKNTVELCYAKYYLPFEPANKKKYREAKGGDYFRYKSIGKKFQIQGTLIPKQFVDWPPPRNPDDDEKAVWDENRIKEYDKNASALYMHFAYNPESHVNEFPNYCAQK